MLKIILAILLTMLFSVLKLKMANSTEAELRQLRSSLNQSKDDVALDLKRNVFDKYVAREPAKDQRTDR